MALIFKQIFQKVGLTSAIRSRRDKGIGLTSNIRTFTRDRTILPRQARPPLFRAQLWGVKRARARGGDFEAPGYRAKGKGAVTVHSAVTVSPSRGGVPWGACARGTPRAHAIGGGRGGRGLRASGKWDLQGTREGDARSPPAHASSPAAARDLPLPTTSPCPPCFERGGCASVISPCPRNIQAMAVFNNNNALRLLCNKLARNLSLLRARPNAESHP